MDARQNDRWGIEKTEDNLWIGPMRADGLKVAEIAVCLDHGPDFTHEYNVRQRKHASLIAAAPEMFDVLQELLSVGIINPTGSPRVQAAVDAAQIAISKATAV